MQEISEREKQIKKGSRDWYEVRIGDESPIPEYTFMSRGNGSSPLGDIIAIKAKSKNGKTFLASILASVILGSKFSTMEPSMGENSKIMFFDTEQNRANTQAVLERIHILCGWEEEHYNRIRAYSLREMPIFERMNYIAKKAKDFMPTAIFIDGLADLTIDFNDIEQSQDLILRVSQLSSSLHCAIFFIIHTNKNKSDNNMKGHLGTLATQKCSDVFYIEKNECDIFSVTETDCRNVPIEDFAFKIDEDGIPYPLEIEDNKEPGETTEENTPPEEDENQENKKKRRKSGARKNEQK